jgi:PAS domain S-box-containing protein
MRQNENINKEANTSFSFSTLKLYNDSFLVGIIVVIIVAIAQVIWDKNMENLALLTVLFLALIFFRIFRNNKNVIAHQICFHQVFVLAAVIIAITWFISYGGIRELAYLLFIGSGSTYLYIEQKTTLSYFIAYHIFLYILSLSYPAIELKYVAYSIIFSSAAIFVSRWLNQLLLNSHGLQSSEKKFKVLFEQGNSAVFLLKKVGDKFEIFDTNETCETVFGLSKEVLILKQFRDLCGETEEKKAELCNTLHDLKNHEKHEFTGLFKRKNEELFMAETTFASLELDGEKVVQVFVNDITEKRLNETKISESVQSFRNIVDNSPISIFIFTDNQLVYKNSEAEQIFNQYLDHSKNDLFEIFPKNQRFLLDELMSEEKNNSTAYTEIVLGEINKEKKFSISLVNVIYDGTSSFLLMLMDISLQSEYNIQKIRAEIAEEANKKLSEEISKHKETRHDLAENTSKLNALFESSSNLFILTIDRDLNISSFNSSFKNMMNYYLGVEVEIGNDFLNTFPIQPAAYGKLIKRFKRALRGESVEIISHFPTNKGEIWVESFISPVKVEGEAHIKEIAFIAHNITEKVENERKVKDSEANNKATVSAIPDMLFKVNKEGCFTDFRLNEDGGELLHEFAFTTELLGKHIFEVFKNEKQAKIFLKNIQKALRTGEVHTQNFIIPFIIGRTAKRMVYENRYSRVNSNEVIVITRDVTDKVEFETQLIESVREKEILLKEVHHRVKNNLQVISSILNLQSSYVEDEKTLEIINESQNRIRSMSYIHESLYQTKDFSSIDFHDYITNLVQNLVHSYQLYTGKTNLNLDIDKVELILDQAIPCGLILNELVSNSLKYAYPDGTGGDIDIEIKEVDGKIKIRVEDFGAGLPKGFRIEESDSLGLGLVDTLVDQIDGELILKTENGTKYLIIFEKQDL